MKKAVKIVSVITIVLFILVNIPNVAICFIYSMPDDAKEASVCFLTPELTWNSTISDVFDVLAGRIKTDTFSAMFENHPMEVKATRRCFSPFTLFRRKKVYKYTFIIKCNDAQDERIVFDNLVKNLVESTKPEKSVYYNEEENKLSKSVYYGPIWADYFVNYEIEYSENDACEVVFKISSVFEL